MFLKKDADLKPHDGFVEWELIPGCWLQVAKGSPSEGSGPLRLVLVRLSIDEIGSGKTKLNDTCISNIEFEDEELKIKNYHQLSQYNNEDKI